MNVSDVVEVPVAVPVEPGCRPMRADARRNRERIVKAARAVFAQYGRDAQMDDVARKAKLGVGTLYRHFPTKEALVRAVIVHQMATMAAMAAERLADEDADPWEAFSGFVLECAERHQRDRVLSQVLATQPSSWFRHAAIEETELAARATALLARAQAAGVARRAPRAEARTKPAKASQQSSTWRHSVATTCRRSNLSAASAWTSASFVGKCR